MPKKLSADIEKKMPDKMMKAKEEEAERALVEGFLLDNELLQKTPYLISGENFYNRGLGCIFDEIKNLNSIGRKANKITITNELAKKLPDVSIAALSELHKLKAIWLDPELMRSYVEIIHEKSILRELLVAAEEMISTATHPSNRTIPEILRNAEESLNAIWLKHQLKSILPRSINDSLTGVLEYIQNLHDRGGSEKLTGVPTGFEQLDELISGLQTSELAVLSAYPLMGTTAVSLSITKHVALEIGLPVLYFSLEAERGSTVYRLLSMVSGVDVNLLHHAQIDDSAWGGISTALGFLHKAPIYIDDDLDQDLNSICQRSQALKIHLGGLGLIIIDSIDRLYLLANCDGLHLSFDEIFLRLKTLAKYLAVPVLVTLRLPRSNKNGLDNRLKIADLKPYGALCGQVDLGLILNRKDIDWFSKLGSEEDEITVAFQRHRKLGSASIR